MSLTSPVNIDSRQKFFVLTLAAKRGFLAGYCDLKRYISGRAENICTPAIKAAYSEDSSTANIDQLCHLQCLCAARRNHWTKSSSRSWTILMEDGDGLCAWQLSQRSLLY